MSIKKLWRQYPFKTVIGTKNSAGEVHVFIPGPGGAVGPDDTAKVAATLSTGGSVILMARDRATRDKAKLALLAAEGLA